MAVKALLAGKAVFCLNADGTFKSLPTIDKLGIPREPIQRMLGHLGFPRQRERK